MHTHTHTNCGGDIHYCFINEMDYCDKCQDEIIDINELQSKTCIMNTNGNEAVSMVKENR